MKHRHVLLSEEVKRKFGINDRDVATAATLPELDEAYTRRVHNFSSTSEMYKWSSSINYLHNIDKPIVFINAVDDPLVPEVLLEPIRKYAETKKNALYIECAHGGHLGFYEGKFKTSSMQNHRNLLKIFHFRRNGTPKSSNLVRSGTSYLVGRHSIFS